MSASVSAVGDDQPLLSSPGRKWLFAALLFFIGVSYCLNLDTRVVIDDPWHSIAPYRLISMGSLSDPVTWPGEFAKHHLLTRPFYNVLLAGTFGVLGLGVEQGRLLSVLFGALAVFGTYLLGREWYGRRVAAVAAILLLGNNILFISARTVRPETLICAAAVFSFFFYSRARRRGPTWLFAAAGVVSGLGVLAHPNMVLIVAAVVIVEIVESGPRRFWRMGGLWIYGVSLVLTCMPFVAHVVAVDGPNGFENLATQYMVSGRSRSLSGWSGALKSLGGELDRYSRYALFPYRTPVVLLEIFCLGVLAWRRWPVDRRIWIVVLTNAVLFALLISNKNVRYLTVLMPFVSIAVASVGCHVPAFVRDRIRMPVAWQPHIGTLLVSGYLALSVAGNVGLLVTTADSRYDEVFAQLKEIVPDDAIVYGSFVTWFALPDHEYYACGRHTVSSVMETVRPTIVIWDASGYCSKQTTDEEVELLQEVLRTRGTHLLRIEHEHYDVFDVYQLTEQSSN